MDLKNGLYHAEFQDEPEASPFNGELDRHAFDIHETAIAGDCINTNVGTESGSVAPLAGVGIPHKHAKIYDASGNIVVNANTAGTLSITPNGGGTISEVADAKSQLIIDSAVVTAYNGKAINFVKAALLMGNSYNITLIPAVTNKIICGRGKVLVSDGIGSGGVDFDVSMYSGGQLVLLYNESPSTGYYFGASSPRIRFDLLTGSLLLVNDWGSNVEVMLDYMYYYATKST